MNPSTAVILLLADTLIPGGREALLDDLLSLMANDRFYSAKSVAERYEVSLSCVKQWRAKGLLIPSMKIKDGTVRYTLDDLRWFEAQNKSEIIRERTYVDTKSCYSLEKIERFFEARGGEENND